LKDWPANSPDLNPIENLWGLMKRKMAPIKRTTLENWRDNLEFLWNSIPLELLEKLVLSMSHRIERCIEAKGSYTKY